MRGSLRRSTAAAGASLFLVAAAASGDGQLAPPVCPRPVLPDLSASVQRVKADDPNGRDFHEISGLAVSPAQVGPSGEPVFYAAADGPRERIGVFDSGTGERLLSVRLPTGVPESLDWEGLAIGPCGVQDRGGGGDGDTCLIVADFGDNVSRNTGGRRSARDGSPCWLYKIREPLLEELDDNDRLSSTQVWVLPYDYLHKSSPSDFADCEAIFIDHVGWGEGGAKGDIYVLTKWNSEDYDKARLHKIPASAWSMDGGDTIAPLYSPAVVGDYSDGGSSITSASWTRADMALDGTVIALGDYQYSYLYLRCPGQSVEEALVSSTPCARWLNTFFDDARQFETTAWLPDGSRTLQLSECYACDMPMVWTSMEYDEATTSRACPSSAVEPEFVPSSEPVPLPSSASPSLPPSEGVVQQPILSPMDQSSASPSSSRTLEPTGGVTPVPTASPSGTPSTMRPTFEPSSFAPTGSPTFGPTAPPTVMPQTPSPAFVPTNEPTDGPTPGPTTSPSAMPQAYSPSVEPINDGSVNAATLSAASTVRMARLPIVLAPLASLVVARILG